MSSKASATTRNPIKTNRQSSNQATPYNIFPKILLSLFLVFCSQQEQKNEAVPPEPSSVAATVMQLISGTPIKLTTKEGDVFDGLFESHICINQIHGVSIRLVQLVSTQRPDKVKPIKGTSLKFKFSEIISLSTLEGVDVKALTRSDDQSTSGKDSFVTDVEITTKGKKEQVGGKPRELAKWDEDAESTTNVNLTLDGGRLGSQWNQFEVNKQLFGVQTSFDENIYTTPLDRNAKDFREREAEAQRIANEIMSTTTKNLHLAEERGLAIDDSQIDEEDRYGAVVRDHHAEAADVVHDTLPTAAMKRISAPRKSIVLDFYTQSALLIQASRLMLMRILNP